MGALILKTLKFTSIAIVLLGALIIGIVTTQAVIAESARGHALAVFGRDSWLGPDIGVSLRDVDENDVRREKLSNSGGVVVEGIRADGPAARAGFRAGDVVIAVDGENIRSAKHLTRLVHEMPSRQQAEVTIVRAGQRATLKVTPQADQARTTLEDALDSVRQLRVFRGSVHWPLRVSGFDRDDRDRSPALTERRGGRLGVNIQDLTEGLADYFGVKGGALVTSVSADTPAKTAGLKPGDVIVKVDGHTVRDTNEMRQRLAQASSDVTLVVVRAHQELTLNAKL